MKSIVIFLLSILMPLSAFSLTKTDGDNFYTSEQYEDALRAYLEVAKGGESAELFYNMGNTYYRMDSIPRAILWYERALILSPGDQDIRANLRLARTKTIDKIIPEEELFFVQWYYSLLNMMSASGWARAGVIFFILALVTFGVFLFFRSINVRKAGFYGALIFVILVVVTNLMSWHQYSRQNNRYRAILMEQVVNVKSTPSDTGTDLFVLHAGTSMQIIDESMVGWLQIRLSDGKVGWLPSKTVEVI